MLAFVSRAFVKAFVPWCIALAMWHAVRIWSFIFVQAMYRHHLLQPLRSAIQFDESNRIPRMHALLRMIIICALLLVGLACKSFAQSSAALEATTAFQKVDRAIYKYACTPRVEIPETQLPKISDLGVWPLCGSEAAKVVVQWYICREKGIKDCRNLNARDEISILSMQAWTWVTEYEKGRNDEYYLKPMFHRNLDILTRTKNKEPIFQTTYGGLALSNSRRSFTFYSEACYGYENLLNLEKFPSEKSALTALLKAEAYFEKYKNSGDNHCPDCYWDAVGRPFGIKYDRRRVANALTSKTFKEFLFEVVFSGCRAEVSAADPPEFFAFPPIPTGDDPKADYGQFDQSHLAAKIREVLSEGKSSPLLLDNVCYYRDKSMGNMCGWHALTIVGFDKVCKNTDCTDCRHRVKIQNNWGAAWQAENTDEGYVDLVSLMDQVKRPVQFATLTWLRPR